jgi:hypothetical protein
MPFLRRLDLRGGFTRGVGRPPLRPRPQSATDATSPSSGTPPPLRRSTSLGFGVVAVVVALGVGAAGAAPISVSTTQTEVTIGGLRCGTQYRVRVNVAWDSAVTTLNPLTKPCPPPPPPPPPLMATGFEPNTVLDPQPTTGRVTNQYFHNTDLSAGLNWDDSSFFGAAWRVQAVVWNTTQPAAYWTSQYLETVPDRNGNPTQALKLQFDGAGGPTTPTNMQNGLLNAPIPQPIHDYYVRYWLKQNADIQSEANFLGSQYWRTIWQYKSWDDYRMSIYEVNYHAGGLEWRVQADNCGWSTPCSPLTVYWTEQPPMKVPINQWFLVEIYLHRSTGQHGRFYFAVNGQEIVDHAGPNYGVQGDDIAIMVHHQIYSNYKGQSHQWMDDPEFYELPPCGLANLPCGP